MICRLEILLKSDAKLSYQMGSSLHGALMKLVDAEISDILHKPLLHPYAQYLERRGDGRWYWVITTLNKELTKGIIYDGLLPCEEVKIEKSGIKLGFEKKELHEFTVEELSQGIRGRTVPGYIDIEFITPTSLKYEGGYLFFPDIRGMYISLLNKYGTAMPDLNVRDETLLEELVQNTRISRYNLRSVLFHIEGGRVPAFLGNISLRLSGTKSVRSFADLLFHFGEYSGIGIKTGLGMGAMQIMEYDKNDA